MRIVYLLCAFFVVLYGLCIPAYAANEEFKNSDCMDDAQITLEMDQCGRSKLDKLDLEMAAVFKTLITALESSECCFSNDHLRARQLAIKAQAYWLNFRDAECDGHRETSSQGSLAGSFFLSCAISLTTERLKQLLSWGVVELNKPKSKSTENK